MTPSSESYYRTAAEKWPRNYDTCQCGRPKQRTAKRCIKCENASRGTAIPTISQPDDPTIRHLPLTKGYVAVVDVEDYDRVSRFKWSAWIQRRGDRSVRLVYGVRAFARTRLLLHRFILGITESSIQVDHIDHDGLNCRRSNMRLASATQNTQNRRKRADNSSGFKGVSRLGKKWAAKIVVNGKTIYLGWFTNPEDGARAYDTAAIKAFGEFACLNFGENTKRIT